MEIGPSNTQLQLIILFVYMVSSVYNKVTHAEGGQKILIVPGVGGGREEGLVGSREQYALLSQNWKWLYCCETFSLLPRLSEVIFFMMTWSTVMYEITNYHVACL